MDKINFGGYREKAVSTISINDEEYYKNSDKLSDNIVPLKIYNPNTIQLLNYIINFKGYMHMFNKGCGGTIVDFRTGIAVNRLNEYFIHFPLRTEEQRSNGHATKFIFDKLATAIKEYLKVNSTISTILIKDHNDYNNWLKFDKVYLDVLYDFLRGKDLKKKFTEEQINDVIGSDCSKDQFLINALEVFKNEIKRVENEKERSNLSLLEEKSAMIDQINQQYQQKINDNNEKYHNKIKDIQNQIRNFLNEN